MAIIGTNPYAVMTDTSRTYHLIDPNKPPTTDNILSTVQGEMVYTEITMSEYELMRSGGMTPDEFNDQIKLDLCQQMVKELVASKMVEFTQEQLIRNNEFVFRARIYATPDDKVQLIRKFHQSIK
jgi:hypothetical protein